MGSQTNDKDTVGVWDLWSRIGAMESELRFDGNPYPEGQCAFPFQLSGQGFFPGGDGLWREDGELSVKLSMRIRKRGAMFLGNDFGTLRSYQALRSKGFENPTTWRNLKGRVRKSGVPVSHTFFTNSVLGLRSTVGSKALDKRAWQSMPKFVEFCQEFLRFQVETLAPRLLVVLGPKASASMWAYGDDLDPWPPL